MTVGFITRAELNPGAVASILLRDAQGDGAHALVWTLFADQPRGARCFLYRAEEPERFPGRFLIVSTEPPTDPDGLWRLDTKPYAPELTTGDTLRFVLRVNPAVTYKVGRKTKRADVVMKAKDAAGRAAEAAIPATDEAVRRAVKRAARAKVDKDVLVRDWLAPRLDAGGARLDTFDLTGWQVRPDHRAGGQRHRLAVADIEGALTVTDPDAFTAGLFAGLGKARAYGCGLLLVRRG